jgi:hypothetical protein
LSCPDSGSGPASRISVSSISQSIFDFLRHFKIFPAVASRHRSHAIVSVYHTRVPKKTKLFQISKVSLVLPFILVSPKKKTSRAHTPPGRPSSSPGGYIGHNKWSCGSESCMYVWERMHVQGWRISGRARRRRKFTDSYCI